MCHRHAFRHEWPQLFDRFEPGFKVHTREGFAAIEGFAVTIDGNQVARNPAYYIIAHAARFARPGSVRIASNTSPTLPNVAFKTPDGKRVLIVLNNTRERQSFNISHQGKLATGALNSNAVATYVW